MTSCFPSSFTLLKITTVFLACVSAFQKMILTTQNSTQLIPGIKTSFRPSFKSADGFCTLESSTRSRLTLPFSKILTTLCWGILFQRVYTDVNPLPMVLCARARGLPAGIVIPCQNVLYAIFKHKGMSTQTTLITSWFQDFSARS